MHLLLFQIVTKDAKTPACECWGDPHCITFDRNAKGLTSLQEQFDVYTIGRFIMAETRGTPYKPPFQVEIQTHTCWKVACICGVVAREGNDAIQISNCEHKFGTNKLEAQILSPQHFSNLTTVHWTATTFVVRCYKL
ncbi:hypothetical protein CHS0354_023283 [Potamilus streckersoni]|uniref:Uncharacterized protein n=1 Tax=Potamilus streckersoni TaxID=2493646 RepID=A0AAE0T4Y7_9BIVA|nr:hypothetical protein CHS0354_023283 [Potamilus streckersoni]